MKPLCNELSSMAIIFDLDDTLFDEVDFLYSSYRAIANYFSETYDLHREKILSVLMTASGNAFDELRSWLPSYVKEDPIWMRDFYRSHTPDIRLRPGVGSTLQELLKRNVKLGIITDGRINTQSSKIHALGLDLLIPEKQIIISEAINADKTTTKPFLEMQRLIPEASNYVYVGDNPAKDIVNPRSLGWTTILVRNMGRNIHPQPDSPTADYAISSLPELLNALFDKAISNSAL